MITSSKPGVDKSFSLVDTRSNGCGYRPAFCSEDPRVFYWGYSGRSVNLATHTHLAPTLKMSTTVPLSPFSANHGMFWVTFTFMVSEDSVAVVGGRPVMRKGLKS